jgi:DNA repair exonuclease SbcCD ATPase subunit
MPFFKDQKFDFCKNPLSLILGKNLDSSNQNPNAVGKSMFFSQFLELIISQPLIGTKRDIIRKGSRSLTLRKGAHQYKIVQSFSPKEKLTIFRDGKDLEYRELTAAREALRKLIPYNSEELQSLVYLDSRVPHPLARGDTAARKRFFTEFFRLHASNSLRKIIKSELDELTSKEGSLREVKLQLKEAKEAVGERTAESLSKKLAKLKGEEDKLKDQAAVQQKFRRIVENYAEFKPLLKQLKKHKVDGPEDVEAAEEAYQQEIDKLREMKRQWQSYNDAKGRKAEYADLLEKVHSRFPEVEDFSTLHKSLRKQRKSTKELIVEAENKLEKCRLRIRKISSDLTEKEETLEGLSKKIAKCKDAPTVCPTCGGPYKDKHAASSLKTWVREKAETIEIIQQLRQDHEVWSLKFAKRSAKLTSLAAKETELDDSLDLLSKLLESKDAKSVAKPSLSLDQIADLIEERRSDLKLLSKATEAFEAKAAWGKLTEEQLALAAEDYTEKLIKHSESIGQLRSELDEVTSKLETVRSLKSRRAELKAALEEKPVLEILLEATSKKSGYESVKIRTICARLEQQVNKFARLVFPEDFKFTFDLETQFNILVHRKYGKREVSSDVRKLSGAEALLFNLILLISLLTFLPKSLRSNLLILDEPTATFGPEMIDSFVKFLPTLNSVIPNIVVITPMPNSPYPGAKVWTVVKKNGWSKFVEGHA